MMTKSRSIHDHVRKKNEITSLDRIIGLEMQNYLFWFRSGWI